MTKGISSANQGVPERKPIKKLRVLTKMSPEKTVLKKDQAEEERELLRLLLEKEGLGVTGLGNPFGRNSGAATAFLGAKAPLVSGPSATGQ